MPFPVAAAVSAGASLLGSGAQLYANAKMNKRGQRYNEQMYERQRKDALSDWNMQNEYNSPSAQMQRYRDAGLNPNLIYGQSNEGGVVRSVDSKPFNQQAGDYTGIGRAAQSGIDTHFNTQMKEATINNLKAQNDNILAQGRLIDAQTDATRQGTAESIGRTDLRGFDLHAKQSLLPGSLEMQDWNVRHRIKDLDIKTQIHEQNLAKNAQSIQAGAIKIVGYRLDNAQKRLNQMRTAGQISQQTYDRELTKAKWAKENASADLLNETRRGAEQINTNRPSREQISDMFKLADSYTGTLRLFK